ncbi:MAG: type II toxin-antitoxin system Phd/YefM family antitoxin [Candidatus Berkelbacteria bacterium]|nr:type II toxin-antitoxin system Phd/YefM family antitoxin [Candidatus Berkelbacteria bacterium]MCR4307853.1 type II toxin-antitoxin system Phd/YefM family antitoxin [Candidatus Berkelbacteria bacterium]
MTKVVKSTELRTSYAEIALAVRGGKNVAVITKRGRPDLALVDLDYLEDLIESHDKEFQKSLRQAAQEKTYSLEEVFAASS